MTKPKAQQDNTHLIRLIGMLDFLVHMRPDLLQRIVRASTRSWSEFDRGSSESAGVLHNFITRNRKDLEEIYALITGEKK